LPLTLSLSPSFHLTRDGEPVELKNRKAQALLVYLALTGQPQTREHLATLLWGDRFDEQARNSLRQALYTLRKAVGESVVLGDERLSLADGLLVVEAGDTLLDGFTAGAEGFDNWLAAERQRRGAQAAEALFAAATAEGADPEAALDAIRQARGLALLDERFARREMELLAGLGRRTEALARYAALGGALRAELDVAPEEETQALAERIKAGDPAGKIARGDPVIGNFQLLVAPFEDLGGGDTATFLARDLPAQVFHALESDIVLRAESLPGVRGSMPFPDLLQLARQADGIWLLTGTTRQIGTRVRAALTATDVASGTTATVETLQIEEAEAFDLLDRIGDILNTMWRARAQRLGPIPADFMDRLKAVKDQPVRFENMIRDGFIQTFYVDYSREGLARYNDIMDYALSLFPRSPFFNGAKGWVLFSKVDLEDAQTRVSGYRSALEYMNRALAQAPGNDSALTGAASISYWLGDFETCDRALDQLTVTGEAFPTAILIQGNSLVFRGRVEEGLKLVEKAIDLGRDMKGALGYWYATQGIGFFLLQRYEDALHSAWKSQESGTQYWVRHIVKIAALARLGRLDDCPAAIAAYHAEYPNACVSELDWMPFADPAMKADFLNALREGGLPETREG
jgi:DNA-binding SARP family transcriptional activator